MEELEMDVEEKIPSFVLNAAVLEVLDQSHDAAVVSEQTLNIEDPLIEKYVTRHVKKAIRDMRARNGVFLEDSIFVRYVKEYAEKTVDLVMLAQNAIGEMRTFLEEEKVYSYDVLVADIRYEEVPYVVLILLETQSAYTHYTTEINGVICNQIMQHHDVLPSGQKKIDAFALIDLLDLSVKYADDTKVYKDGTALMQDVVLHCTSAPSSQEVIETVTNIVMDVAKEHEADPAMLLPKVKQYIRETSAEEKPLVASQAAEELFADDERMYASFMQKTKEAELPEETEIPQKVIGRKLKNQKIRTDTGIELSFPVEYFNDPDKIRFINEEDGSISIQIHHIGKIMPRK